MDLTNIKERLILTGIDEIQQNGVYHFSLRQVARKCGLSCAAPFKHFKDKQQFLYEIFLYVNEQWYPRQNKIVETYKSDVRRQLLEIIIDYIRFLVENPHFMSIILLNVIGDEGYHHEAKHQLSATSRCLIKQYCMETAMPAAVEQRKTFAIRSLLYGSSQLFINGDLLYNEENLAMLRKEIENIFDSP